MKKQNFLDGAIIVTIGLVLCKILGIIYIVPFRSLVGPQGGALYSYAYSIYGVFVSLSSSGIPIAISKIVSEYNALGYFKSKEQAFKIGSMIITGMGILSFSILFIFAPTIAKLIIGEAQGGNSINDVIMVVRIISTAILFVPLLSVYKGYLQGHRIMTIPSIATVLEQLVRVAVIILGSFLSLKVFHLSLNTTIGIAVFGATAGAIIAYFYIFFKVKKHKKTLTSIEEETHENVSKKEIIKKILFYAIPFIIIDVVRSAYSMIDTFTVVRSLTALGYATKDAENVVGILTTWGNKLSMIIISIAIGITTSLIPNIVGSLAKKEYDKVNFRINQTLQVLFFTILPMTVGLAFLARPVWTLFYGYDAFSINIFRVYIFQALSFSLFFVLTNTSQTLNKTKIVLATLSFTFIVKWLSNVSLMNLFIKLGVDAYYAPTVNTIIIQLLGSLILLISLSKVFKTNYKDTLLKLIKTIICVAIMIITLMILEKFMPINSFARSGALIEIIVYAIIGGIVYFISAYKSGLLEEILGKKIFKKAFDKFKKNKN